MSYQPGVGLWPNLQTQTMSLSSKCANTCKFHHWCQQSSDHAALHISQCGSVLLALSVLGREGVGCKYFTIHEHRWKEGYAPFPAASNTVSETAEVAFARRCVSSYSSVHSAQVWLSGCFMFARFVEALLNGTWLLSSQSSHTCIFMISPASNTCIHEWLEPLNFST